MAPHAENPKNAPDPSGAELAPVREVPSSSFAPGTSRKKNALNKVLLVFHIGFPPYSYSGYMNR